MQKQTYNQRGIGSIEVILIVAVVITLGLVGWFVYRSNQKQSGDGKLTNASQSKQNTQSTSSSARYLEIKELGLKLTLTADTKDMTYFLNSDGDAILSSNALAKEEPKCAADYTGSDANGVYGVGKVTSFVNPDGYDIAVADTNRVAAPDAILRNGKYYYIRTNQSFCVNIGKKNNPSDKAYQIESTLVKALRDTIKLEIL